jgi:hypothetical protein
VVLLLLLLLISTLLPNGSYPRHTHLHNGQQTPPQPDLFALAPPDCGGESPATELLTGGAHNGVHTSNTLESTSQHNNKQAAAAAAAAAMSEQQTSKRLCQFATKVTCCGSSNQVGCSADMAIKDTTLLHSALHCPMAQPARASQKNLLLTAPRHVCALLT